MRSGTHYHLLGEI